MLIEVSPGGPGAVVVARQAGIDEADAIRAGRGRRRIRQPVRTRLAVDAEVVRVVDILEAEFEVVAARLAGQVVRGLRLHLRLGAEGREGVPAGARLQTGNGAVDRRDVRRRRAWINRGDHRPVEREPADVHVEERAVAQHRLPLAFVHLRPAVLRQDRLRRHEGGQVPVRLLFVPALEISDQRVVLADLRGALPRVVVEQAEIRRNTLRYARYLLVNVKLIVGPVKPDLVLQHRTAEIRVSFPEQQVRVVALQGAAAVGGASITAPGDVVRCGIVADKLSRLVREMLEAFEAVAATLDDGDNRRAGRVHLDVAAERADRHFLVRVVILIEAGPADAFGVVHAV